MNIWTYNNNDIKNQRQNTEVQGGCVSRVKMLKNVIKVTYVIGEESD